MALADTRQLRSRGLVSVDALCTEGVTRSEGREGVNGNGNGIGVGNEDGNGDGGRGGVGTEIGVETVGRSQDKAEEGAGVGRKRERRRGREIVDNTGMGAGTETRAVEETGKGTGAEMGTGSETGKRTRLERKGGKEESSGTRHIKTRHCYSARSIIFVDMRWRVQLASSFRRKIWRRPNNTIPRGKQGTMDRRKETVTGTGT